ncbi:MAG: histidine kinase [Bacteroidota bacterium]
MDILKRYETWSWDRLKRHILYWSAWTFFLVTVNTLTGKEYHLWQWIAFEGVVLPIKMGSTYIIAYGVMPRFLYSKQYAQFLTAMIFTALVFGALLYSAYKGVVYPTILKESKHYPFGQFIYKGVELVYIAAVVMGIKFFQNYLHEQQKNQMLLQEKVEAELKYLKNQIQPHFLFNTLNNIYGMMLSQDEKAADYIVKLSDLLSYMLYESDVEQIALQKEAEMLDSFIELERLRYDRKLDIQVEKTAIPAHLKIAPLLMIPFVENAFKHGPACEEGRSHIKIQLEVQQEMLYFFVENTFPEMGPQTCMQSGIGLENIQKRLALLYPERHTLTIQQGATFQVALMIDLN